MTTCTYAALLKSFRSHIRYGVEIISWRCSSQLFFYHSWIPGAEGLAVMQLAQIEQLRVESWNASMCVGVQT